MLSLRLPLEKRMLLSLFCSVSSPLPNLLVPSIFPCIHCCSFAASSFLSMWLGTSAQQLDASFSTNATLEIFEIDFRDPSLDLKHKGILSVSSRYYVGSMSGYSGQTLMDILIEGPRGGVCNSGIMGVRSMGNRSYVSEEVVLVKGTWELTTFTLLGSGSSSSSIRQRAGDRAILHKPGLPVSGLLLNPWTLIPPSLGFC